MRLAARVDCLPLVFTPKSVVFTVMLEWRTGLRIFLSSSGDDFPYCHANNNSGALQGTLRTGVVWKLLRLSQLAKSRALKAGWIQA